MEKTKFIKLTSLNGGEVIYINVTQIGSFYAVKEKIEYGRVDKQAHSRVGVTTHNNGGFEVIETIGQIIKLIENAK